MLQVKVIVQHDHLRQHEEKNKYMTTHVDIYFHDTLNKTKQIVILIRIVFDKAKIIILHKVSRQGHINCK